MFQFSDKQNVMPSKTSRTNLESNLEVLRGLEPAAVWTNFAEFCEVPCIAYQEAPARELLKSFGAKHGFEFASDKSGNVALYVPGRGAGVGKTPVTAQFHLDLVRTPFQHNFATAPMKLVREIQTVKGAEYDVVSSGGKTTIGADNRLAGGMILAAAVDPEITDCRPIIILATWGEEVGLKGAQALDPALLRDSKILINLDNELLGEIINACAGQATVETSVPLVRVETPAGAVPVTISMTQFPGGHSGMEIHQQRGNAIKVLVEKFAQYRDANPSSSAQLASITGGAVRNAIPSSAAVLVWANPEDAIDLVRHFESAELKTRVRETISKEQRDESGEPRVSATIEEDLLRAGSFHSPLAPQVESGLLAFLRMLPHGVIEWEGDPQLNRPALSNNVAVVKTGSGSAHITSMARHVSSAIAEAFLMRALKESELLLPFRPIFNCTSKSSGWNDDAGNPVLEEARKAYAEVLGYEPTVTSVHAGIECGEFAKIIAGIKQLCAGPTIFGAHSEREAVVTDSVPKAYAFLKNLFGRLAHMPEF